MVFECADGSLGGIASVGSGGDKLKINVDVMHELF
jgi:hypothetical protein